MFLKSDYHDLMPPFPEHEDAAAEKKGVSCFFDLLGRSCGTLLKVNLLFLCGCIPLVTIPLSLFALNQVAGRIVRDQPTSCLQIFGETFRHKWKQSYFAFVLTAVPLLCAGFGAWFYFRQVSSSLLFFVPFLVCSTIFLVTLLSSGCLYSLLDSGKQWKAALRLSLLLGVATPQRTVPAALCGYGLLLLAVLFFPLSGLYLLLLGCSLPCMIGAFLLRVIVEPFINESTAST